MSYLLRVQLPDVPGSLGRLASAIGEAGGNIDAIEIVSRGDGFAVDDVFLAADGVVMPDSIVSACQQLDGVSVLWISRYAAGTNLFLDLEAVESMTREPTRAAETLVDVLPQVFRVDWGMHLRRNGEAIEVLRGTPSAPTEVPAHLSWPDASVRQLTLGEDLLVAGSPIGDDEVIVIARRGGPAFLDSEIARLNHLVALALSIDRR